MEVKQEGIVFGLIWFALFSESALMQKKNEGSAYFSFLFMVWKYWRKFSVTLLPFALGSPFSFTENRHRFPFLYKRLIFPSTPLLFLLKEHRKVFVLAFSD